MIELWGRKNAYNVQKTSWMLAELGLEYAHHDLGSHPGDLESPEFLELNPHARIPVLVDDGAVIWESNTILRYLGAKYSAGDLWPLDPFERSRAERWMDWELTKLQESFISLFWNYYRTPEESRDRELIDRAGRACTEHLRQLDRHLAKQEFLAGDRLTVGDIPCAVCLYRYFNMGLDVESPANLDSWYQRLAEREPYRSNVMLPFDELRGRTSF